MHFSVIEKDASKIFSQMLNFSEDQHEELLVSYQIRIQLLEKIIEYYVLHNEGISGIKSLDVLKEVFH